MQLRDRRAVRSIDPYDLRPRALSVHRVTGRRYLCPARLIDEPLVKQLNSHKMSGKEQIGQIIGVLSLPWILYLIWDAIRSESVLVKGRGEALGGFARRVYRADAPVTYWFFVVFYVAMFGYFGFACRGLVF